MSITDEATLDILFYLALLFGFPLLIISIMSVGKHFADLQYQIVAKLNGIRWIQSWMNLRIHSNRVAFASAFLIVSILGLADVDLATRMLVGRSLWLCVLAIYFISSILDWRAEQKQLRILIKYEEVNNIPAMRLALHKLNGKLTYYYGLTETLAENEEQKKDIILAQEQIRMLIRSIQLDLHSMDPSYKTAVQQADENYADTKK